jgi:beta-glucosidase
LNIEAAVSNTGEQSGSVVVQVYASLPHGRVERPVRRLVGFARCTVAAGDTTGVVVKVPVRSLAVRDVRLHDWHLEAGEWVFDVAQFSGDPTGARAALTLAEERFDQ